MAKTNLYKTTNTNCASAWILLNTRQIHYMIIVSSSTINEPPRGKTNNVVSEQVRHKPGCTVTDAGWKLEISVLRRRGTVLSV